MSQFAINNSSLYANTLTSNVAFTAKGTATVTGLFTASGRAVVGTNLGVTGNSTFTGLTTASGRLTVGTNLNVSGNSTIGGAGKTANVQGWFGVAGRASVSTNLFVGGNTYIMGGYVGLGLTNPGYPLTVLSASGSGAIRVVGRSADSVGTLEFINNSQATTSAYIQSGPTYLAFATGTTERLRIHGTGLANVAQSLIVQKNFTVSGNTTLSGTINVAGANILQQTLADGATVNWNVALGQIATITLGGNRTMAAPTNLKVGTYILHVYQDGTGSRTLTWNAVFKWTAGVAPPLTSTINAHDVFSFVSDGTNLYGSFMPDVR
jgi:hypothetical protein